jgi:hypothetical protein
MHLAVFLAVMCPLYFALSCCLAPGEAMGRRAWAGMLIALVSQIAFALLIDPRAAGVCN